VTAGSTGTRVVDVVVVVDVEVVVTTIVVVVGSRSVVGVSPHATSAAAAAGAASAAATKASGPGSNTGPATATAEAAAPVTAAPIGASGSSPRKRIWLSQASGPSSRRNRPIPMFRNARTTVGSKCVPEQRAISRRASSAEMAGL
jgi:hypothetical protein